jgi:hypothetical protein
MLLKYMSREFEKVHNTLKEKLCEVGLHKLVVEYTGFDELWRCAVCFEVEQIIYKFEFGIRICQKCNHMFNYFPKSRRPKSFKKIMIEGRKILPEGHFAKNIPIISKRTYDNQKEDVYISSGNEYRIYRKYFHE